LAGWHQGLCRPHRRLPGLASPAAAPRVFYYERNASAASASSRRRLLELGGAAAELADVTSPAAAGAPTVLGLDEVGDATSPAAAPGRRLLQEEVVLPDATYILNQNYMTQADGEKFCVDRGGHLVSYLSVEEQVDVEQYFVGKGWLYSNYNKAYWIGLQVGEAHAVCDGCVHRNQHVAVKWLNLRRYCCCTRCRCLPARPGRLSAGSSPLRRP
jgi:hypothetical protein